MNEQPHESNERKKIINTMFLIAFGVLFYMFVSDIEYIHWTYGIIKPLLHAFVIAYLLNPLVKLATKRLKLTKHLSIVFIILLLFAILFFVIYVMVPNIGSNFKALSSNFPSVDTITQNIDSFIDSHLDKNIASFIRENSQNAIATSIEKGKTYIINFIQSFLNKTLSITTSIINLLISLIIAIYMLLDKDDLIARLKRLLYAYAKKDTADYILKIGTRSNDAFMSYITGKFLDSTIIGLLCLIALTIAGVPYASIIALIVGITNMIEYFGPFIGAVPAIIITLFSDFSKTLWVGLIILALQQFDGLYLGPKIVGKKVGLRAFWVVIAVIIGGSLFGVIGMILGVPATVLIRNLIEESVEKRLKDKNMVNYQKEHLKR